MHRFVEWLSQTPLSLAIQTREWIIPTIQSVHIVAIAVVMGSVFMIELRIWGWAGRDQTMAETTARFGPWLMGALVVLLLTGAVMVVGEPERELLALSFWLKMILVAIGTIVAVTFQQSVRRRDRAGEPAIAARGSIGAAAVVVFLIWVGVIVLGRLIAYDYVWGSWSLKG
jgi:hypothetical protein